MGNHQAGRAMGLTAVALLATRTDQGALVLLDIICNPYRGCDAEFESEDPANPGHIHPDYHDYTSPDGPIGKLIIEAFDDSGTDWVGEMQNLAAKPESEQGWEVWEAYWEQWHEGPESKFRKRYEFC